MPANTGANPYTRPAPASYGEAPGAVGPRWGGPGRYTNPAIPESTMDGYTDAYSPSIAAGGSSDGTVFHDDIRIGRREPPAHDPNHWTVHLRRWSNRIRRSAAEIETQREQPVVQQRVPAPSRPIWEQDRLPTRPLARTNPAGGTFRREWHIPQNIANVMGPGSEHRRSLADHRQAPNVRGMVPRGGVSQNIWKPQPAPWDEPYYVPRQAPDVQAARVFGNNSALYATGGGIWR